MQAAPSYRAASPTARPRRAPGPPGILGIDNVRQMEQRPLAAMMELRQTYGDVARVRLFGLEAMLISHPEGVRHVLQERHTIYTKNNHDYKLLARVLGQGLVTSDGALWKQQRRLIQPAFHKERVRGFASLMAREAEASAERLLRAAHAATVVDVVAEAKRTALDIVVQALIGVDADERSAAFGDTFSHLNELVTRQFTSILGRFPWIPTHGNRALRKAKLEMDRMVEGIIARRRAAGIEGNDLLGMLLASRDEDTGKGMSDEQLRDEVTTLLAAGHETTAMTLGWTVYLLGRHPEWAHRVAEEADAVLGGRAATYEDLEKLEITRRVIEESLRIYPPAWAVSRTPSEEDEIDGYRVPRGALVFLSQWVTHRHPDFWPDAERFDPDRFAPEAAAARPRFAHFPFLMGPRMCIGFAFAAMEARIVLATWLSRLRLPLADSRVVEPEPLVTIQPRGGVQVRPAGRAA
ncbi:MAG TPA: cytochrome P450 [Candidatus Limnocylindrales bacterium]|nr:cytochrome P450 [Candidatus Limnocylindrales bacterium]